MAIEQNAKGLPSKRAERGKKQSALSGPIDDAHPTDFDPNEEEFQRIDASEIEPSPVEEGPNDKELEKDPLEKDTSWSDPVDPFEFLFEKDWASRGVSSRSVVLSVLWSTSHITVFPTGRFFFLPTSGGKSAPKYHKKWDITQETRSFLEEYLSGFYPGEPFLEENFLGILNQRDLLPVGTKNERHLFNNIALQFVLPGGSIRVFSLGCLSHLNNPSELVQGYVGFRKWLGGKPEEKKKFQKEGQKFPGRSKVAEFLVSNNYFTAILQRGMPGFGSFRKELGSFSPFLELVSFLKAGQHGEVLRS
ncbi:MAG TPA: hypothetical protein P5560_13900 [Thermotogota bacterium]|nr:hypothetical protein [Thermotogota bacterium]HRW94042.1 hypothetical protein [Thermotogota bacterium]